MIIGNFTYNKQDKQYSGSIHTLNTFRDDVLFQPNEKASEGAPDFRVVLPDPNGIIELGAAWRRIDKNKKEYLSVLLDDPARAKPLYAALLPASKGNGAILVWSRPDKRKAQAE
jgi:uncharacterized protein (DUF736 family)